MPPGPPHVQGQAMSNPDPESHAPSAGRFPPRQEPMFNLPGVVLALAILLALVHTVREFLSPNMDFRILNTLAFMPARFSLWLEPERLEEIVRTAIGDQTGLDASNRAQLMRLLLNADESPLHSLLTYGLLHGSWIHLVSNLLWLVAFASPVARRTGAVRFLLLMGGTTVAGALAHWWFRGYEMVPMVGASAAIAGAMAAAARFVFSPGVNLGGMATDEAARAIPAEPLLGLWRNGRAMGFIAIWFITNTVFGAGLIPLAGEDTNIAWQAHIGGFVAGLLLFPLLDRGRTGQRR